MSLVVLIKLYTIIRQRTIGYNTFNYLIGTRDKDFLCHSIIFLNILNS